MSGLPGSLDVIALISGGKDSLFSILHCLANGHRVVALANLHPPQDPKIAVNPEDRQQQDEDEDVDAEGEDLNSYMYQTVGHSIIPLYAEALGIPLYRQEILGGAVCTARDYAQPLADGEKGKDEGEEGSEEDETESLIPLLKKVLAAHPTANAISTGAILSTYQRTRIESIALRLGLTPLSYLWQYPVLPPYSQSILLHDMAAVQQDSRIIKVASGGLDEGFLWENVASYRTIERLKKAMARFGENGDGAVVGEGGEFETLAIDGPKGVWRGRLEVEGRGVGKGEGGAVVFRLGRARVVVKKEGEGEGGSGLEKLRMPEIWDDEFKAVIDGLDSASTPSLDALSIGEEDKQDGPVGEKQAPAPASIGFADANLTHITPTTLTLSNLCAPSTTSAPTSPTEQLHTILTHIRTQLSAHALTPAHITHVTILLRRISDFAPLNTIYTTLFTTPNPPSRVTVACGDALPAGIDILLSLTAHHDLQSRKGLHVQSRSYWAPANIGPYSQAVSVALPATGDGEEGEREGLGTEVVYLAGQIPLLPGTMQMSTISGFKGQVVLALQHLWRVGRAMRVRWWMGGVAYIASGSTSKGVAAKHTLSIGGKVKLAQQAWQRIHAHYLPAPKTSTSGEDQDDEDEEEEGEDAYIDPWDLKNRHAGPQFEDTTHRSPIPDPAAATITPKTTAGTLRAPPCFVVQVDALPRNAQVEWHSTGLAQGNIEILVDGPGVWVARVERTGTRFFALEIGEAREFGGLEKTLEAKVYIEGKEVEVEQVVLYAGPELMSVEGQTGGVPGLQWVPSHGVWGRDGRRIAGVLVGRVSILG